MSAILDVYSGLPDVVRGAVAVLVFFSLGFLLLMAAMNLIRLMEVYISWAAGEKPDAVDDSSEVGHG